MVQEAKDLPTRIRQRLFEGGIDATVTVADGVVHLEGTVSDPDDRPLAVALVAEIDPTLTVQDHLRVVPLRSDLAAPGAEPERLVLDEELLRAAGDVTEEARELLKATEESKAATIGEEPTGEPVFAPTDPLTRMGSRGLEVLGGFAATSMDEVAEEGHEVGGEHLRGDEEIADDVRRELREDAMTTDLALHVVVLEGVVYLRGRVASLDEAEAAEEVAGRVPGVVEVREKLDVGP
jgi:osmotically-inducible protein OsmY